MSTHVFPSLARSDWAYTLNSDPMALFGRGCVGHVMTCWAGQFQTHGDGLVQHSGEIPIPVDARVMSDWLASLAAHVLESSPEVREEVLTTLATVWPSHHAHNAWKVRFARTVKYKDGKRRYYSLSEQRMTTADSKRYDKRWAEVPEWADGSVFSCFRLCRPGHDIDFLDLFLYTSCVVDRYEEIEGEKGYSVCQILDLDWTNTDPNAFSNFRQAYYAVVYLLEAHQRVGDAKRSLQCYRHNAKVPDLSEAVA